MKQSKGSTPKVLFISILSLLICLVMLLGTASIAMANDNANLKNNTANTALNNEAILEAPKFVASDEKIVNAVNSTNNIDTSIQQGTPDDPYLIRTSEDLELIRNNLTASFKFENDIDMSGIENFVPFGIFEGELDGNGKVIKNLTIECNWVRTGFIALNAGKIQKLGFENVNIKSVNTSSMAAIGGIAAENQGIIENCYINGTVTNASSSIMPFFGGAVGYNNGGDVTYIYTTCRLEGILSGIGQNYTGVMVGYLYSGDITKSYYIDTQGNGKGRNSGAVGEWTFENLPLNEAGFKSGEVFAGWDTEIWSFQEGQFPSFKQSIDWLPIAIIVVSILFVLVLIGFLFDLLHKNY